MTPFCNLVMEWPSYVNDANIFDCTCKFYADDIKLYSSYRPSAWLQRYAEALDELQHWSDKWQLNTSYKKCNILQLVKNNDPEAAMTLDQNVLVNVNSVKDLGVTVNDHLKFDVHINNTVAHAHRLSSLINKFVVSQDPHDPNASNVKPLLEYASCIWSPHHIGLIRKTESVQQRCVYITAKT